MKKENITTNIFLFVTTTILFAIPLYRIYPVDPTGTYNWHIDMAQKMAEGRFIGVPHFLYQGLIIFVHLLAPYISFTIAGFYIVPLFTYYILALVIYSYINQSIKRSQFPNNKRYAIPITFALMLVTPVSLFTYPRLYLGYIGISMYHSATTLLAKPLSLLVFTSVIKVFEQAVNYSKKMTFYLSVFTVLSLIAKPNYIICLIPAIFILIAYKVLKKREIYIDWRPLFLGFYGPAILVLAWQFSFTYLNRETLVGGGNSSIIFAPFLVMSFFSQSLLPDFLFSILFPLSVYIIYFKKAIKDLNLNLAWLTFLFSAFYVYFLAESGGGKSAGDRIFACNFCWSGQLALFILFVVSTGFFLKQFTIEKNKICEIDLRNKVGFFVCSSTFLLHVFSGLVYFIYVAYYKFL